MALLKIQTGSRAGSVLPIEEGGFLIGRDGHMQLRLSEQGASRQHAEIFRVGGLYFIRDLTSRNGTFVNEKQVTEVVLRDGDHIRVGETVGIFLAGENSPKARVLRVDESLEPVESIRYRDTIMSFKSDLESTPQKELKRAGSTQLARQIAHIIATEPFLQTIFEKSIAEIGNTLQADRADILLVEPHATEVKVQAIATYDTKGDGEVTVSRTILNEVIQRQDAVFSTNALADKRYKESASIMASTIRSVIAAPIQVGGATTGLIYVCNSHKPEAFQRDDVEAVAAVALQLSAVLANLKHFEAREDVLRSSLLCLLRLLSRPDGKGENEVDVERSMRIARYSRAIAAALGLARDVGTSAWVAGLFHHLARDLSSPDLSQKLLAALPGMEPILEAITCQDERQDGSGTPRSRLGDEIPLLGRILSLAKELDRLASTAATSADGLEAALKSIRESAGRQFHPDVVQACLVAHRNGALTADLRWPGLN